MSSKTAFCAFLLALPGCALVVQGTSQEVMFESRPPGASFTVAGQTATTPKVLTLPKDDYQVVFSLAGYVPKTLELKRQVSAYFYVSIVLGLIAAALDMSTGAWKEFQTAHLLATLEPEPGTMEQIQVRITSDPPAAEVWLDEVFHGRTPGDFKLEWRSEERMKQVSFRLAAHHSRTLVLPREERTLHASLDPRPVTVRVHIRSKPPGAEVRLDGRAVGPTPAFVDVDWLPKTPPKILEGSKEGYHPARREIRGPQDHELLLDLQESVEEIPFPLRVVPAGAHLEVNGTSMGEAPGRLSLPWSVSLQRHTLKFAYPGHAPRTVEVRRDEAAKSLEVRLAPLLPIVP